MPTTDAILGLTLSTNGAALTVGSGWARDASDADDIVSSGTLQVDPTVTGIGGLEAGPVAANTVYAVWILKNSSGAVGAMMSTSFTPGSIALPDGWKNAKLRRIGTCSTDANGGIHPFVQSGRNNDRTYTYTGCLVLRQVVEAGTSDVFVGIPRNELAPLAASVVDVRIVPTNASFEARSIGAAVQVQSSAPEIYGYHASNDTDILEYRKSGGTGSIDAFVMGFSESL